MNMNYDLFKQQSFLKIQTRCQQETQKREKEVQELRRAVETLKVRNELKQTTNKCP